LLGLFELFSFLRQQEQLEQHFLSDAFPIAFIITKGFLTTTRTTRTTLIKYFKNSTYGLIDDGDKGKRLYLGRRVEPAKSSRCAGAEPAR